MSPPIPTPGLMYIPNRRRKTASLRSGHVLERPDETERLSWGSSRTTFTSLSLKPSGYHRASLTVRVPGRHVGSGVADGEPPVGRQHQRAGGALNPRHQSLQDPSQG